MAKTAQDLGPLLSLNTYYMFIASNFKTVGLSIFFQAWFGGFAFAIFWGSCFNDYTSHHLDLLSYINKWMYQYTVYAM